MGDRTLDAALDQQIFLCGEVAFEVQRRTQDRCSLRRAVIGIAHAVFSVGWVVLRGTGREPGIIGRKMRPGSRNVSLQTECNEICRKKRTLRCARSGELLAVSAELLRCRLMIG